MLVHVEPNVGAVVRVVVVQWLLVVGKVPLGRSGEVGVVVRTRIVLLDGNSGGSGLLQCGGDDCFALSKLPRCASI